MPCVRRSGGSLRYRIRTLLIVVAVFAIVIVIVEATTRGYRERLRIEAHLQSMGAYYVSFGSDNHPDWVGFTSPTAIKGIGTYRSIRNIDLAGAFVNDQVIKDIASLERIWCLHMTQGCDVTDDHLRILADTGCIEILRLNDSQITDDAIPAIASINGLKSIDLSNTLVTEDGVTDLKRRSPGLTIRHEP